MTSSSRDAVWKRIMDVQEEFNRLEQGFASIPAKSVNWWLQWRFKKALHAMMEVRGAHSHGEAIQVSERRLPKLERVAQTYSLKLAQLQNVIGRNV